MINSHKKQQGFTLIEVMVTSVILSIAILGCLTLQTRSTLFNAQSLTYLQVVSIQENIINTIRANYKLKQFNSDDFQDYYTDFIEDIGVEALNDSEYSVDISYTSQGLLEPRLLSSEVYVGRYVAPKHIGVGNNGPVLPDIPNIPDVIDNIPNLDSAL